MQQFVQPRSSSNGYARRKSDRDTASKFDSKSEISNTNSSGSTFGTGEEIETLSRDRLIYLTTCLIGHQVEIQVLDGSVYSGIFHATNAEDFGVVLKMAQLIKDGSRGQKHVSDSLMKSRTLIIPAKDLVQVIAKGVPVTRDGFTNDLQQEKQQELMTDACISQSRHVDLGRELERWVPDENDPECPELENIFDGPYRGWDQFEANQALFGVTSTFDEELYTTKLERGPRTRELEREALRIAREIEGEETLDLHLAEERGIQLDGNLEIDEETRFSSVYRGVDDSGYDEIEDILLDSRNDETFGGVSDSLIGKTLIHMSAEKHAQQLPKNSPVIDASRARDNIFFGPADTSYPEEDKEKQKSQLSKAEVGLSPNAAAFDPSNALSDGQEKVRTELSESAAPPKARPSSSASSASDRGGATSTSAGRGLSPSSLSSEKSTLNPHAKEFKFNPNAKSFSPSQAVRPSSPGVDSPCYYPPNMTHMQGMPMGVGPSFASHQPVMFNPQAAAVPQQYYHPNGPQYGQQMMMMGQPRPVFYMQPYQPEMPYK